MASSGIMFLVLSLFFFEICVSILSQSDALRVLTKGKCNETNDIDLCNNCRDYVRCKSNQFVVEMKFPFGYPFGTLCSELGSLVRMESLTIVRRQLSGTIPTEFNNLVALTLLRLSLTQLSGTIPSFDKLISLWQLDLDSNQLSGTIPSFDKLTSLQNLVLAKNQLSGAIPSFDKLISIDLSSNQLSGAIPSFDKLISIDLSSNQLSGTIPSFDNLTSLTVLYLHSNRLSGTIPSFDNLTSLTVLYLFYNQLSGTIPSFDSLTSLRELRLYDNQLNGTIPSFNNLTSLAVLSLSSNQLSGTIPSFDNLTSLTVLYLHSNRLSGSIPSFDNLTSLTALHLNANQLSGTIPSFDNLTFLAWLHLHSNQLSGSIPSFNNLASLSFLDLSSNQLSGTIPSFDNLTSLIQLFLDSNQLNGTIPSFNSLTFLEELRLTSNQLNGTIPSFDNLSYLRGFRASSNQLSGTIPSFDNLTLLGLYLDSNQLSGTIPSFDNLSRLRFFWAFSNQLNGTIPSFNHLTSLVNLDLSSNQLSGTIPSFNNLTSLVDLDLSSNQLSGTISSEIGLLITLRKLYLYSNQLSGTAPTEIGLLLELQLIALHSNELFGDIPSEFGNLFSLHSLLLANNEFRHLPPEITKAYRLQTIDLSNNLLENVVIHNMSSLETLLLKNNNINRIDLNNTSAIFFVDLSYNNMLQVPLFLFDPSLTRLTRVSLSNNVISSVDSFRNDLCYSLTHLDLSYNNISSPPTFNFYDNSFPYSGKKPVPTTNDLLRRNIDLSGNQIYNYKENMSSNAIMIDRTPTLCSSKFKEVGPVSFLYDIEPQKRDYCRLPNKCQELCVNGFEPLFNYTCGCHDGKKLVGLYNCTDCIRVGSNRDWSQSLQILAMDVFYGDMCGGIDCNYGSYAISRNQPDVCYKKGTSSCSYPCIMIDNSSNSVIQHIIKELGKDKFLNELMESRYNRSIEISEEEKNDNILFKSSSIKINFNQSCERLGLKYTVRIIICTFKVAFWNSGEPCPSTIGSKGELIDFLFFKYLNLDEIVEADGKISAIKVTISEWSLLIRILVIISIVTAFIVIGSLLVLTALSMNYLLSNLRLLPSEIRWSFMKQKFFPWQFSYSRGSKSGYYYRSVVKNSADWNSVISLFQGSLGGHIIPVESITSIYNPILTSSFINAWNVLSERFSSSPHLFNNSQFADFRKERNWVRGLYEAKVSKCEWNTDLLVPIIPCCHGTDLLIAEKIAETGFASLSSLDEGYFGKGIYFTSFAMYTIPYCAKKNQPSIIISWLFLGNVYPVIERQQDANSLLGKPLKNGFNSHYVVTNKFGDCLSKKEGVECLYDEIVIVQESQILPAFILKFSKSQMPQLLTHYKFQQDDDSDLPEILVSKNEFDDAETSSLLQMTDFSASSTSHIEPDLVEALSKNGRLKANHDRLQLDKI